MAKVSVIVPNYNHAKFLPQRLVSIFNQTYQDFEVILLDDCSTDNSIAVLKAYASNPKVVQFIVNDRNSGSPFKQWERGIRLATGDYIWIAESDDIAEDTFLSEMTNILGKDQSLNFVFCKSNWINDKSEIGKDLSVYERSFKRRGLEEIREKLVQYNSIQNVSSVLFRSSILKKLSKRYTKYYSCGDWILYTENLQHGYLYFTDKVLNNFRWYHNNVSNNSSKQGLWVSEGVDVLKIAKRKVKFTDVEKEEIIRHWFPKVQSLSANIPFCIAKFYILYLKLFLFAPAIFLKLLISNQWER